MIPFLIYQLKVTLCTALFTAVYFIWLRKETFHRFNRIYLIASLVFSFILPAVRLRAFIPESVTIRSGFIDAVIVYSENASMAASPSSGLTGPDYIALIYWTVASIVAVFLFWQLIRIFFQTLRSDIVQSDKYRLVLLPDGAAPFSFLHYIFIGNELFRSDDSEQVLQHEFAHARQLHSLDIILVRMVRILQWFNPFVILAEKALKETHEYLADNAVLEQDGRTDRYRLLLLAQVFGLRPGIFNFFHSSLIKNRIMMMTKEKSPPLRKLKYLAVIPMSVVLVFFFSCADKTTQSDGSLMDAEEQVTPLSAPLPISEPPEGEEDPGFDVNEPVFVFVEDQATFLGGDLNDFRNWVQEHIVYPPEAIENNIFGRVTVQFAVSSQGEIMDVVILRGVEKVIDDEVIRVILSSPKWVPAQQAGIDVAQQFTIPVVFTLTE